MAVLCNILLRFILGTHYQPKRSEQYKNIAPGLIRYLKWYGITDYGTKISNGTYFFTVKATSLENRNVIKKLQKLSKIN